MDQNDAPRQLLLFDGMDVPEEPAKPKKSVDPMMGMPVTQSAGHHPGFLCSDCGTPINCGELCPRCGAISTPTRGE